MRLRLIKIFFLFFLFFTNYAFAQMDPSAGLLLKPSEKAEPDYELDSSRYTIKQPAVSAKSSTPSVNERTLQVIEEQIKPKKDQNLNQAELMTTTLPVQPPVIENKEETEPLSKQVKTLVLGGDEQSINEYRQMLHPHDARRNIIELSLSPIYIYNNSSSPFWVRDYFSSGPGFSLGADIWLSPFLGIKLGFLSSLSTQVNASPTSAEHIQMDFQEFNSGILFRKFFGLSRTSSFMSLGVDFDELQTRVPSDAENRLNLKTSGVFIYTEAQIAQSSSFFWVLGAGIIPKASHTELNTGTTARSGVSNDTNVVKIWLGNKFTFDRRNQVFWQVQHRLEQNLFSGDTNINDPITGDTIRGSYTTNGLTIFSFGYTWGQ